MRWSVGLIAIIGIVTSVLLGRSHTQGDFRVFNLQEARNAREPGGSNVDPGVRAVFYNIQHGAGIDGIVDLARTAATLQALQPDIVVLAEVDVNWDRSGKVDQVVLLAHMVGLPHTYFAPAFARPTGLILGEPSRYGLAVLSRYPIVEVSHEVLPHRPSAEPRVLVKALVQVQGETLTVYGTHLGLSAEERSAQVARILERTAHAGPRLLMGDLNARPHSEEIQALLASTHATWIDPFPEAPPTFPSQRPTARIDYALVSPELLPLVRAYASPATLASDHLPVVIDLHWPPTKDAGDTQPGDVIPDV